MMKRIVLFVLLLAVITNAGAYGNFKKEVYDCYTALPNKALYKKADTFLHRNQKDSALVCYTIIVDRIGEKEGNDDDIHLLILSMGNLSYIYSFHDFNKSYTFLYQAIHLAEQHHFIHDLPYLYLNMACLMKANDDIHDINDLKKQTTDLFRKSFHAAKNVGQWSVLLTVINNVANIAIGTNKVDNIKDLIHEFNSLTIPSTEPLLQFTRYHCLGAECLLRKDYHGALSAFSKMETCEDVVKKNDRYLLMVYSDIANVYAFLGEYDKAIDVQKQAVEIAISNREADALVSFYKDLRMYYQKKGDKVNSDKYYLLYLQQNDSLYLQNKLQDVDHLRFVNDLKEVRDQVKDLSYKHKTQTIITLSVMVLAVLIVIILLLIMSNNRKLKRKNKILFQKSQLIIKEDENKRLLMTQYKDRIAELESKFSETSPKRKYQNSNLDEDTKDELGLKIIQVMESSEEIYSDTFSVDRLAELVGWKHNYVSQVISEKFGKNFNTMLAEYRIREACRRMNDTDHYGNYSIEGIAASIGYKSRSNFSLIFKRITGLSPSEYQQMIKEKA